MDRPAATSSETSGQSFKTSQGVPKETLEKLAARLKELVGEDFEMPNEPLVNEDGLPIIEFKEPVPPSYEPGFRIPSPPPLKPLPKTEAERITRRKELDAFFEALEEEERREEEEKEETEFMRVIKEAKEKAEDARTGENTRLNAASQKKRNLNGSQSTNSSEDEMIRETEKPNLTSKTKKAVKFAGVEDEDDGEETENRRTVQWGDVQQGRLKRPMGVKSGGDIMKLQIVERFPASSKGAAIDSDDEDDSDDDAEDEDDGAEDAEREQAEIEDALQQREIALRYHELRHSLGTGPTGGALGGPIDPTANQEWDQEEVSLDTSLADTSGNKRFQFNANRLSDKVLKTQLPNGLVGELRPGVVENDQLIGTEEEGASDEDINPRGKRIIDGLTQGLTVEEVLASEPIDDEKTAKVKQPEHAPIKTGTALVGDVVERERNAAPPIVSSGKPTKVSRFKANRME